MLNLYTEVAVQTAPATPLAVTEFQIPRKNGTYEKSKYSSRIRDAHTKDESDFSHHHLASASDIYFRQHELAPRSILWRVVGEGKTLELLPIDLTKSENDTTEAYLTLRLAFQDSILPGCVAVIDDKKNKEIDMFACTSKNEIFHLRIHPDVFRKRNGMSQDVGQWCSALEISSLSIETVYRVYAHTPYELFIAYTSGKVQRLRRGASSKTWTPENYDDRTWGASFRGMVGRGGQRTIEYGSASIDSRAVQRMVASEDSNFLYTVCLNHQLRIWHLPSGRLVIAKDLLNDSRDPHERLQLNPSERGIVQLLKRPHMKNSILITFSPHDGGQFKFWDVKESPLEALVVEDRYPGIKLIPPDPDPTGNTIWSITGFHMHTGNGGGQRELIDVLWRNDNHHQLYSVHFDLNDMERSWKQNWVACTPNSSRKPQSPTISRSSAENISSQWLDFLLWPGRYSVAVLETALSIFSDALPSKSLSSQKGDSLKSRLAMTVASNVVLRKYENSVMDYDRFATDTDHQWKNFWRIVENLNDSRSAPLAYAFDAYTSGSWIVMTDKCCAVVECNELELVGRNDSAEVEHLESTCEERWLHRQLKPVDRNVSFDRMASLLDAAQVFREAFPVELAKELEISIEEILTSTAERSTPTVIYELYDAVNFSDSISDDLYHRLQRDMEPIGGLEHLNDQLIQAVVDSISASGKKPKSHLQSTIFGLNLLSAGFLDHMVFTRQIFWDLLVLVIFVEGEMNQDEEKMANFNAAHLFTEITEEVKMLDRNIWLSTHSRAVPIGSGEQARAQTRTQVSEEGQTEETRTVSILEDSVWKNIRPQPVTDQPQSFELLRTIQEIQDWSNGSEGLSVDNSTTYLLCDLLRHDELSYASSFLKFLPSTPWSTYIKGRLYLSKALFDSAATYFRQPSFNLAHGKAIGQLKTLSCGLVTAHEANAFYNGLPLYFHHILTLFESHSAYSQVALFAHLALQSLPADGKEPQPGFKQDTLSRLFTSQLRTSEFSSAFTTLTRFTDPALQKSSCTSLINAVLDPSTSLTSPSGSVQLLQSLSWSLHPQLARHLDTHLSTLAKRQTSLPTQSSSGAGQGIDYLSILQALYISKNNYRGAVGVLYDRLKLIQRSGKARSDPKATSLRHTLLALINLMTCIGPEDRYILADVSDEDSNRHPFGAKGPATVNGHVGSADGNMDGVEHDEGGGDDGVKRKRRRIIITLEDLRREYQHVLDRCARIERGDFEFDDDDEEAYSDDGEDGMDVDGGGGGDASRVGLRRR